MRVKTVSLVLVLFVCLRNVKCDKCEFSTCSDCIKFPFEQCAWCAQENFNGSRCMSVAAIKNKWCEQKYLMNPESKIEWEKNEKFNETKINTIQLKPQIIKMKLRPGIPQNFSISYKPAKDFPIDIYYLMDVSYTMESKFNDLKKQAKVIYKEMMNYTDNVRLGVGSFIEKRGFPFFDVNVHHGDTYRNIVPLTYDMAEFDRTIETVKDRFGSNYDDPEAGFDALMQTMMCEKEIGWRTGARRIIVLCTDSTYHSAGDGKIVGAIKPNDMKCHLKDNLYTEALTYDYPSVSQINKVATKGKFKIIFAIAQQDNKTAEEEYIKLASQISGAKYAKLKGGSSVVKIIKEAYEEMTGTVEIPNQVLPSYELTFDQDCKSKTQKRNCVRTHTQPIVTIPGKLKVKSCPNERNLTITVSPIGLDENLTIYLEIDCKCECEKEAGTARSECNSVGVKKCGICYCDPGSYGANCQCNGTSTLQRDMEKCVQNGTGVYCSGQGECICGKCNCKGEYSGDFCEYNDNSCSRPGGVLCFGKGKCTRGSCNCDEGWVGDDCACPLSKETCFAPNSKEECSGNGKCHCGKCECNNAKNSKDETIYSGVFCDSCEECAEKRCKELENYVHCNYEHMDDKKYCDQQYNDTTKDIAVFFVNKTEINSAKWYMAVWCKKQLENGTYIIFKYQYEDHQLNLVIQKESELPPEANLWIAAGSAIGIVLLIGLLTVIIWKVLVDAHDKREYQKFAKEAEAAGYDVSLNPIYSPPAVNFENPAYNCNS